jgi:RHS repeat-associated protein
LIPPWTRERARTLRRRSRPRSLATLSLAASLSLAALGAFGALGGDSQLASASGSQPNGTCGFCMLAPSGEALKLSGSGDVSLTKANVLVNSSSKPALKLSASGSLKAPSVGVVGTASVTGSGKIENLTTGIAPVADPLSGLAVPSLTVPTPVPSVSVTGSSGKVASPGVYKEISDTASGSLTLEPGTYVILQKFANTGSGTLTAKGVTLYLACANYPAACKSGEKGATLTLTGSGPINFTAPEDTCSPVAVFSDRNSTAPLAITGSGSQTLDGVLYAKSGALALTGSGGTFTIGGPIVVSSATTSGSGAIQVTGELPMTEGLALALGAMPTSARVGQGETLTATLSCHGKAFANQPVTFAVTGANAHTESVLTNSAGVATFSYTGETPGTDTAQASYAANGGSVTSAPASISWSKAQPSISTKPVASPVTIGEAISDTATVAGGYSPTGTVSFNVYASSDTSCKTPLNAQPLTATLSGGQATSPTYTPSAPGAYQFVASYEGDANNEAVAGHCGESAEQASVEGSIGPIDAQPQSTTVNEGSLAAFTSSAPANPAATVQWQLSTDGGSSWSNDTSDTASTTSSSGRTTSTLEVSSAPRAQNGYEYRAVFSNAAGSVASNAATLTVDWIGPVTTQPESKAVNEGQQATFSAAASANPGASVQWQVSTDGGSSWVNDTTDSGNTSPTLTISSAEGSENGYEYRAVFSNAAGSVASSAATLTVVSIGPITSQPQSASANEGAPATFTAAAAGYPAPSVQWQVSTTGGLSWEDDPSDTATSTTEANAATSTLEISSAARAETGYEYRAVFTNAAGSVTSNAATLSVNWVGPLALQPQGITVNEGRPASFTASVSATPDASVAWQLSTDGGLTWSTDGSDSATASSEAGSTSSTLTISSANRAQNGYEYRAVFTNGAGSVTSSAATLGVIWIGPVEAQPQGATVDEGAPASFTAISPTNPGADVQWQVSTDGGSSWSNDTADNATTLAESDKTSSTLTVSSAARSQNGYEYRAVFSNAAGSVASNAATLTVDWIGPITTQPESQSVVEGKPASLTAAASANPGAQVQWQLSSDAGVEWSTDTADSASTTSNGASTTSTLTIASAQHSQSGYDYRAIFTNGAGSATSSTATVVVERATLCTDTYTGANNGLWQKAVNWSTGTTPTASDVACVGAGTTVDVTEGTNVAGVLLDQGGLTISGGTLELASPSELMSVPGLESSTVADLEFSGGGLYTLGTVDVTASLHAHQGLFIGGGGRFVLGPAATGSIVETPCAQAYLNVTFENQGALTLGSAPGAGDGAIWLEESAQFRNFGTFNDDGVDPGCGYGSNGASFNNPGGSPSITNTGTFNANLPSTAARVYASFTNLGKVNVSSGVLALDHGGSSTNGTWTTGTEGVVDFNQGSFTSTGDEAAEANWADEATLSLPEGRTAVGGLSLQRGRLELGGELAVTRSLETSESDLVSGSGKLAVAPGAAGRINASGCGQLELNQASLSNQGTLTDGQAPGAGNGMIVMRNGAKLENGGTFSVDAFDAGCAFGFGGYSIVAPNGGEPSSITNTGTFNVELGTASGAISAAFANNGSLDAKSGAVTFQGGGASTHGVWEAAEDTTLGFARGTFALGEATWTGPGTFAVSEGSVAASKLSVTGMPALNMSGGSLAFSTATPAAFASFALSGGTLSVAGEADVSSLVTSGYSGPTITGGGKVVVPAGANASIAGQCVPLRVSGATLENDGTVQFGPTGGAYVGTIVMEHGAQLVNAGTFNDDSMGVSCGQGNISINGSGESAITNTGTWIAEFGSDGEGPIYPEILNQGEVRAVSGTLGFRGGSIPGKVSNGCWFAKRGISVIYFASGNYLIEEGGVFDVSLREGTGSVTNVPNGLSGTVSAPSSASGTVAVSGHGEEASSIFTFTGASVESTPAGRGEWTKLCGPLGANGEGDFSCQWNTSDPSYPAGSYEVRARLLNSCACQKQAFTTPIGVKVEKTSLTLSPARQLNNRVGREQTFTATVTSPTGAPLAGETVTLGIEGANARSLQAVTDATGHAAFSYTGAHEGADAVQASYTEAGGESIESPTASVWWAPAGMVTPVASTPVHGNFFARPYEPVFDRNRFRAEPGYTPVFSQDFPNINFNPLPDNEVSSPSSDTKNPFLVTWKHGPFTDLTTDPNGAVNGEIVAEGNGHTAGVGSLEHFEAEFTAEFHVAQAGDVTFKVNSDDGYLLGIGGGATPVSHLYGPAGTGNEQTVYAEHQVSYSAFEGLPLVAGNNLPSGGITREFTVHFPAAGSYPYELDYFQEWGHTALSLGLSVLSFTPQTNSPLSVYGGYAYGCSSGPEPPNLNGGGSGGFEGCDSNDGVPSPWYGVPEVTNFIGQKGEHWDSPAIMLHNNTGEPVTIEQFSVDAATNHYQLWGSNIEVDPNSSTTLAQTEYGNFDIDDAPPGPTCTNDRVIPEIHITINGRTETIYDGGQVLNLHGIDPHDCYGGGESEPWTPLGLGQVTLNRPPPAVGTLELSPAHVLGDAVNQSQELSVRALDTQGRPVANLPVNLRVYGTNARELSLTTDSEGVAKTSYAGASAGHDSVQADATISGEHEYSNSIQVNWAVPQAPPPPPPPTSTGSEPPSIEITEPRDQGVITAPTPVAARITGAAIESWKATLSGNPGAFGFPIRLGEGGSGTPPPTLGTIDPSKLGEGTYTLTVSAQSEGGSASESEQITVGTTPGLPPPPPVSEGISITEVSPAAGSVIGVPTYASATTNAPAPIWEARLHEENGTIDVPLPRESTGNEHTTRTTIYPSEYPSGTYILQFRASSQGREARYDEVVTLGTGVATTSTTTGTSSTTTTTSSTEATSTTTSEATTTTTTPATTTTTTTSSASSSSNATPEPPTIGEISPEEGTIVRTPVPVKAQITAPPGESIASWSAVYQGSKGENSGTLASGKGSPPETLATFDPTKLPDDTYKITVMATTSGGAVGRRSTSVIVSGNLKLGRFLQTYKDLEVPVSGFNMQLERVYDSTDKSVGDFGVGWHLLLSNFTVSTNGPLGKGGWTQSNSECEFAKAIEEQLHEESPGLCAYAYESAPEHTVTVTWPDKHQEVFVLSGHGQPLNNFEVEPRFTPRPGTNTTSTLQVAEPEEVFYTDDGNLSDASFEPWNPTRFVLTTREGRKFSLSTEAGLVSEEDLNHNKLIVTNNGIESSSGPKLTLTRDSQGRITEVTGPSEQHLHYGYDATGDLASYTDADENTTTYGYDASHHLLTTTGPGASRPLQTLHYDEEGRISEVIDAEGHATKIESNVGAKTETVADPNGKLTTINTYDERGDLLEEVKAFEGKTLTTMHTYDAEGHRLSTTDPLGHTRTNTWEEGDLVAHKNANGNTTRYAYDSLHQVTAVIGPDGKTQLVINRNGEGQPIRIERPDGSSFNYDYGGNGNVTEVVAPSGTTERFTYDEHGYPKTVTDGEGHTTNLHYDQSGQLTEEEVSTDAKTEYGYDGNGNLTSVADGLGHVTTFTYDAFGHELAATDPLGKTETSTFDEAGRLVERVDRNGEPTSYAYDLDGKLTEEASANGESTKISYDGAERPVSVTNQTQTLGFAYDGAGRVTETSASAIGASPAATLSYAYDPSGNRTALIGPEGTTSYGYDAYSRLTSLTAAGEPEGKSFGFAYTPTGQVARLTRPNGVVDTLSYLGEQMISRVSMLGSTSLASTSYGYDASGHRSSITGTEGRATVYHYDPLGELTEETPAGTAGAQYEYDAAGNRSRRSGGLGLATYSYNEDEELVSNGAETFAYDARGELVKRTVSATGAVTTYRWNPRGELAAITLPTGKTESFAYDPLGRRVSASDGQHVVSYVYDGPNVHLEYEGSATAPASSPSAVYTDGLKGNEVLEMARGGKRYAYLVDGQGSTLALADEGGTVAARYSYDAFGNPTVGGSVANPFLYAGQMWEPESGLYYDRARYYEPNSGRFISRDPLLRANPYPYVGNDPTNATDPSGEVELEEQLATTGIQTTLAGQNVTITLQAGERAVGALTKDAIEQASTTAENEIENAAASGGNSAIGSGTQSLQKAGELSNKLANLERQFQGPFGVLQKVVSVGLVAAILAPEEIGLYLLGELAVHELEE